VLALEPPDSYFITWSSREQSGRRCLLKTFAEAVVIKNPRKTMRWSRSQAEAYMVAQYREAEHHYDVIEPKAALSNLEQFSLEGPPGLLVRSLSQKRGQDTPFSLHFF
jgi:hypothetical protein